MNNSTRKSDEELAVLVQNGQIDFFGVLMERYEAKIKRYLNRFLISWEDSNDLLQNVFLKSYENIKSFNSKMKFSPWIYRIAHNEAINYLKKKKTLPLVDFDVFLFPYSQNQQEVESEIDKKIIAEKINQDLEKLSAKYREVATLYYLEGFSYKEIADIIKAPVATVGVRLKRAKEALKSFYQEKNEQTK